jgi:hypothetical protein
MCNRSSLYVQRENGIVFGIESNLASISQKSAQTKTARTVVKIMRGLGIYLNPD